MAITAIKRLFSGATPIVVLFVLLLTSLYLMSGATHNSAIFSEMYSLLLVINVLAIALLIGLIGKNLYDLVRQYRKRVTGSRLTVRLVLMFVILSVTPVSVVYYFSLDFLQRGIDSWFDVRVEQSLNDALELSKASLGIRMRELLRQTRQMSLQLNHTPDDFAALTLNDLRIESDASELTLFSLNGHIIASSSTTTASLIPVRLADVTQRQIRQGQHDVGLITVADAGLHIRVAVRVASPDPVGEDRVLQALHPVAARINTLAESVQQAFSKYREVAYLRKPLKYSFVLTLSLVLLLSILTAIWAAFYSAQRMVAPISDLVEGTRAVAAGNYDKRLPLPGKDELGFLVRSFNEMTHKIALAQEAARLSQQHAEEQHAYLDVVLANLSSGVLTLDPDLMLHTSNTAASHILGLDLKPYEGKSLDAMVDDRTQLHMFVDVIYPHLEGNETEWQDEAILFGQGGRQVLMCRGTSLPSSGGLQGGHVIVFDDITTLVQAQRNAAWGEVARRLAHEIKNPLTPIQLSAERLRHKYLKKMDPADAEVLDRSTHTIVQQVETLKEMVKAFSDYARMPMLQLEQVNLNNIVNEVLDLYRGEQQNITIHTHLESVMPPIEADVGRLRQVLHNLIKNALEAMEDRADASLTLTTHCVREAACNYIELKIQDTGAGIPADMMDQLFEPYITSKPRGSGLGLAIVKKIVEEHGGMLWAENTLGSGATITIRLPTAGATSDKLTTEVKHDNHADDDAAA